MSDWGIEREAATCEQCDWLYLFAPQQAPAHCPHCGHRELVRLEGSLAELPYGRPPELLLPFTASHSELEKQITRFAKGIWFAPRDLNVETLLGRLQPLYLPMWLVDSDVSAKWQAEVGYDYQVLSHRDKYQNGRWVSQEVKESRIRWEPRAGRLRRTYHNITAPALEEQQALQRRLGEYELRAAGPYQATALQNALVRLPDRTPQDAWPDAEPAFKAAAADECRQAAEADHLRDFRWQATFANRNWTQLLLPVYATYYLDDENEPQTVLLNGRTARIDGRRRASMRRAQQTARLIGIVAALIFVLSLIGALVAYFMAPALLTWMAVGVVVAAFLGLMAVLPIAIVWQFNRSQKQR